MAHLLLYDNGAAAESLTNLLPDDLGVEVDIYFVEAMHVGESGKEKAGYPGLDAALAIAQAGHPVIITGYISWPIFRKDERVCQLKKMANVCFLVGEYDRFRLRNACLKVTGQEPEPIPASCLPRSNPRAPRRGRQ